MNKKTRKLMWSAPLVAVLAVIGALAMFAVQAPGSASANPLPAAPTNLKVAAADGDAGRTTLVLSWTAPAGNVSGYRIDKSDQGSVWETLTMDTGSAAATYTDDTLTADDIRWYRVFAVNSHGFGPVSNAASGETDDKVNPGSVMNLTAVPNPKKPYTQIDLSWDPPADNGGEKIVGYEIQFHYAGEWSNLVTTATPTATTNHVTRIAATKTKITDTPTATPLAIKLDAGDKRLYRVRAINGPTLPTVEAVGPSQTVPTTDAAKLSRSKKWARVEGMTKAAMEPGQVTGLTAVTTAYSDSDTSVNTDETGTISLYWYDPQDTGGWDISGYVIQAHRQGKKFPTAPTAATIKAATFTDTGPTLGSGDDKDNATWYQTKSASGVLQAAFTGIVDTLDGPDQDTTPDMQQTWYFRVYAVTTDHGPDNNPAGTTDNVIRRSARASDTASDKVENRATAGPFDRNDDGTKNYNTDPLAAPGIDPTGAASTDALTDPPASDAKKQQIDLELTLADSLKTTTSPAVVLVEQIAYRIDYSDDAGDSWKLLERDTRFTGFGENKPYADDAGLDFDETRHYRVFAIGRDAYADVGPPSTIQFGKTKASAAPKKPTGVKASSPSLTSITAEWTAPKDNGGQPIVKYLVQWVPDDGDDVAEASDFITTNPNADAADIDDTVTSDAMTTGTFDLNTIADADALEDDTVYAFRVAGVNKVDGTGADRPATDTIVPDGQTGAPNWSDPVLFDTTEAAKPNAVEGLTSERATDASGNKRGINLLWNKPSDKIKIGNYDVEVQDEDGDWANPTGGENLSSIRTSYTDSSEPKADEVRTYRVRATNEAGDGPWTMVTYPRTPADHTHVAASGTIMDQTVTVGMTGTVDASMYFTDAEGATYSAESDKPEIATAAADASTGMVTITGVMASDDKATVTVKAKSGAVEAMQTFMVTVVPAALGPPTNVMAKVAVDDSDPGGSVTNVVVTWTDGDNADAHWVGLYDVVNNQTYNDIRVAGDPSAMTHTFANVPDGTYLAAVISTSPVVGTKPMVNYARNDDGKPKLTVVSGQ